MSADNTIRNVKGTLSGRRYVTGQRHMDPYKEKNSIENRINEDKIIFFLILIALKYD